LILKARNRFKSNTEIVDIVDLASVLYGPGMKMFVQVVLVATNASFLMAYCMFLGFNVDQIVCKGFKAAECHQNNTYTAIILLALYPLYCLRSLNGIGYFSAVALLFTFVAIILILYINITILTQSYEETKEQYNVIITDEDRDYVYFDPYMVPVVVATLNALFEGNQQILNIYAETHAPSKFFNIALWVVITCTLLIAVSVGYTGYLAFGNKVKSVIIYNLPYEDPMAITIKFFYLLTIAGSFVLISQPIFRVIENTVFYKSGKCCQPEEEEPEQNPMASAVSLPAPTEVERP
jgi:amino acid permease